MSEFTIGCLLCLTLYTLQSVIPTVIKYPLLIVEYFLQLAGNLLRYLLFLFWGFLFLTHTFVLLLSMTGVFGVRAKSTGKVLAKKLNKNKFFSKEFDKGLNDWIKIVSSNKYFGKQVKKVLGNLKVADVKLVVLSIICGTIFSFVGYTGLIILFIKLVKWLF